ncbi:MAG: YbhB/YbcL family Raf kinase inhibitor-like protein [Candidatus Colwellbacteria bacterium CG10_big_fil_rev_8_21_14_0_10_41_28]|uniref:YbhB/YbcL family Raf kinase inhibitor-like protein n=1 Tax=Candidatus Colwellbacteria bacterium CG10_big_fil_rev_8_21_14_0_10_41_28 TaxID=1974539 RepID=A0A2H0VK17_9BACT|nr:MAG: YbhB/YbcL family Raf kinase inhibitor-like protein [Candidatus Colwellbacteria bacterium CG10_big_fil_rev_8_21_14_0_10_41_28]
MNIESSVFEDGGSIPTKYTCDGENISPPLKFTNVPEGAMSLALIMHDPDVPTNLREDGVWDHWLVWGMSPDTIGAEEGEDAPGITGTNTAGNRSYGSPCPPDREHRYFFTLYALDIELDLDPENVSRDDLLAAMDGHIIEEAQLMGRYDREI